MRIDRVVVSFFASSSDAPKPTLQKPPGPGPPVTPAEVLTASFRKQMEGGGDMKMVGNEQVMPVISTHKHG
jgi:hypothetical protein